MAEELKELATPDFSKLIEMVKEHVAEILTCEYDSDYNADADHYIYEKAIEAIYGEDAWSVINKCLHISDVRRNGA